LAEAESLRQVTRAFPTCRVATACFASHFMFDARMCRNGVPGAGSDMRGALAKYEEASRLGGVAGAAALCALAQLHEHGIPNILPRNLFVAAELYNASAAAGNATAQFTMGVFHSYGLFGASKSDLLANLYYYMSSMGGYGPASTALGYRHAQGLTVPKSCSAAVQYYRAASAVAVDQYLARGDAACAWLFAGCPPMRRISGFFFRQCPPQQSSHLSERRHP
jgi:hypothetical protein